MILLEHQTLQLVLTCTIGVTLRWGSLEFLAQRARHAWGREKEKFLARQDTNSIVISHVQGRWRCFVFAAQTT